MRNKEILIALGNAFRAAREKQNLSQDALASQIGVATKTLANAENCKYSTKADTLIAIAMALDVSLDQFYRSPDKLSDPVEAQISQFFAKYSAEDAVKLLEFCRKNADYVVGPSSEENK